MGEKLQEKLQDLVKSGETSSLQKACDASFEFILDGKTEGFSAAGRHDS